MPSNTAFCLLDVSAEQHFKQSEFKHFLKITNYELFQHLKVILHYIYSQGKPDHIINTYKLQRSVVIFQA